MNTLRTALHSTVIAIAIVVIAACGGGGSDDPVYPIIELPDYPLSKLNDVTHADIRNVDVAYDDAGNGMAAWVAWNGLDAAYYVSYFDASVGSWSAETQLAEGRHLYSSMISIASNGTTFIAAYTRATQVYVRLYAGSTWEAEVKPDSDSGTHAQPQIASNGSTYMLVWDYGSEIKAAIYTPGIPGTWSAAVAIESTAGDAKDPQIASDGNGYAVVWHQYNESSAGWDIYANIYAGGTWGTESSIAAATGAAAFTSYQSPYIASNGSGYAAIWIQLDGISTFPNDISVYASIYNGNWGTATELNTSGVFSNGGHIASNGTGYGVSWSENGDIYADVHDGNNWSTSSVLLSTTTFSRNTPWVSTDGTGYQVNWFQTSAVSGYDLFSNIYTAGTPGQWGSSEPVESGAGSTLVGAPPVGSYDGTGYICLWGQFDGTQNTVYYNSRSGAAWDSETNLIQGTIPGATADTARIAVNKYGDLLAVWDQFDNGRWYIYTRYGTGGAWEPISRLSSTENFNQLHPDIASNGTDFMVVWGVGRDAMARTFSIADGWGDATVIDNLVGWEYVSAVHVVSNGLGYAAGWSQGTDGWHSYANIYANDTWGTAAPIDSTAGNLGLVLASNGTGYAAAWYHTLEDGTYQVYGTIYDGNSWGAEEPLDAGPSASWTWSITLASDGEGYAASWDQQNGSGIYANVHDGSSWADMTTIATTDLSAKNPGIASNGIGYMLAWSQNVDPGNTDILISEYDGSTWSASPSGIENMSDYGFEPSVASNGKGYAIAWRHGLNLDYDAYFNVYDGTSWTGESLMESAAGSVTSVTLKTYGKDYLAIWLQEDSAVEGKTDLWVDVLP